MRLWSIHPKHIDSKGLVALWREGLLAKKALEGKTKGYTEHSQLERFKQCSDPLKAINTYLYYVYNEATRRGFNFDKSKIDIDKCDPSIKMTVSSGQLGFESNHLARKVRSRKNPDKESIFYSDSFAIVGAHPMFKVTKGGLESWEKV